MTDSQNEYFLNSSLTTTAFSLSFAEFMEKALYDPENGYYASGRVQIGKTGDFFTNVSVGKIYGKILALFFEELWEKMERPELFTIVEQGAHDGRLASDILEAAASSPRFLESIHYYIVEPFACHLKEQQAAVVELGKKLNIFWVEKIEELPEFEGIHFSNELLDAFPIHLLRWNGKEWLEQRVLMTEKEPPAWITAPITQEELCLVVKTLPRDLAPHFLWEVRIGISYWLQTIAQK